MFMLSHVNRPKTTPQGVLRSGHFLYCLQCVGLKYAHHATLFEGATVARATTLSHRFFGTPARTMSVPGTAFAARNYQVELLEVALKKNTIVCLGTGTGKTFIAVLLIKEFAHTVVKPFSEGGQRIVFIVPSGESSNYFRCRGIHYRALAYTSQYDVTCTSVWQKVNAVLVSHFAG